MIEGDNRCIRFGVFEFSPQNEELRKRGMRVKLGPLACKALALLLESPGKVHSRTELRQRLWPADVYVDFEHSLNKTIHTLRTALDDSPTSPRYIETVAGRGYRFIPAMNVPAQLSGLRPSRKVDSIAVLPFVATTASPEVRFAACQIAAQLTHSLSSFSGMRVLAHSTVKHCDAQGRSPQMIGNLLGVRAVIFAEVSNGENELFMNMELIDVASGLQLWGTQMRQLQLSGVDASERVVRRIARQLQAVLAGEQAKTSPRLEKKPPAEIRILKSVAAKRSVGLVLA